MFKRIVSVLGRYGQSRLAGQAALVVPALCLPVAASAATISVPTDHLTIQAAVNAATPGDTIEVSTGVYNERVSFPASGSAGNPIVLRAGAGQSPVIDGTGISVGGLDGLVYIEDQSYLQVIGFEIRNYFGSGSSDFPAGIWVRGELRNIELRDNVVHDIENAGCGNCGAHGIAVYGTSGGSPISNVVIDGNTVRDCILGWSEAVVLNGNVENFTVSNNVVHDNNNIGIDMIGFEGACVGCPDALDRARDGIVVGNHVYNIDSQGNPAYGSERSADGIYVDGGTRIIIERNTVHDTNIGIEIASEHSGKQTSEIIVRSNVVYSNHVTGLAMGGYNSQRGSTEDCTIVNNTFYDNDTDETGSGEVLIQFDTRNNVIKNNIFYAGDANVFLTNYYTQNSGNVIDSNLYFSAGGAASSGWAWKDESYSGFSAWKSGSGNDANSIFIDPAFVNVAVDDFHLLSSSPAVNAGEALGEAAIGTEDVDGDDRVNGWAPDLGADEITQCGDGNIDATEQCDDGNLIDGDGCDSNCTHTGCGNTIVTGAEQCDDGNTASGDCCSGACNFEFSGSPCVDGNECTSIDQCDGAGICLGFAVPDLACLEPDAGSRGSQLKISVRGGTRDKLGWKWGKGTTVALGALGDPTATDEFAFCVLVDTGAQSTVFLDAAAPAGARWALKGSTKLQYKDASLSPDGLRKIQFSAGPAGKSKAKVQGKGAALAIGSLPLVSVNSVRVEIRNLANGTCFASTYASPFKRNESDRFQARSD